ncbi:MAG: (deoxy)nucleoside triphosphate pyrophosphohydrolase [Pirellulaceae bacterium]
MPNAPTQIAIAVVERDGRFLVGVRPAGKPLAGYAEFPGGRAEADETPEQAAIRECFEETGVAVEIVDRYEDCQYHYAHDRVHLYFLACRTVDAGAAPRTPFRWVSRKELAALKFPPANQSLLSQLLIEPTKR